MPTPVAVAFLSVFKSPTSVQLEPSKVSVFPVTPGVSPPIAILAVLVPAPARDRLASFRSATSVQLEPS